MLNNQDVDDKEDVDDVLMAFSEARAAAPDDKTLLRLWTARYPDCADDLIAVDYARFAADMTLLDALEDGPVSQPPLTSLVLEAAARGFDAARFAQSLRLDRLLLGRLEQRVLDAATLPVSLVRHIARILQRGPDEVAAYLRGGPRLAAQSHFRARRAPVLSSEAERPSFAQALLRGQNMSEEDKDYWQGEIEAGVLGE